MHGQQNIKNYCINDARSHKHQISVVESFKQGSCSIHYDIRLRYSYFVLEFLFGPSRFGSQARIRWRKLFKCGSYKLQPGHYSSLTAPNLQRTANQERND